MPQYTPPLRDMQFLMQEVLGLPARFAQLPAYADVDTGTMDAILEEAGKFASEVIQPLNQAWL